MPTREQLEKAWMILEHCNPRPPPRPPPPKVKGTKRLCPNCGVTGCPQCQGEEANEVVQSMYILPFGKHKGEDIEQVPTSYLHWMLDQEWIEEKFPKLYKAAETESNFRDTWED